MGIVCEKGINDMPNGWIKKSEWNKKVYNKWKCMLERVYSEKVHNNSPTYINTTLQLEMHWLSYFVEHFKKINGYDEEKFLSGELELDKDIKSNGQNKEYSVNNCMLVSRSENSKQSNKTMDYSHTQTEEFKQRMSKINKGKHKTDEHKKKLSDAKKGKYNGKNNPRSKKVAQYDLDGNLIKIWYCTKEISEYYKFNNRTLRCHLDGKCKTHEYKGYTWYYLD